MSDEPIVSEDGLWEQRGGVWVPRSANAQTFSNAPAWDGPAPTGAEVIADMERAVADIMRRVEESNADRAMRMSSLFPPPPAPLPLPHDLTAEPRVEFDAPVPRVDWPRALTKTVRDVDTPRGPTASYLRSHWHRHATGRGPVDSEDFRCDACGRWESAHVAGACAPDDGAMRPRIDDPHAIGVALHDAGPGDEVLVQIGSAPGGPRRGQDPEVP